MMKERKVIAETREAIWIWICTCKYS